MPRYQRLYCFVLLCALGLAACSENVSQSEDSQAAAGGLNTLAIDVATLGNLTWTGLDRVAKFRVTGPQSRQDVISLAQGSSNVVAIYLGALWSLMDNHAPEALEQFLRIPADQIAPAYLYAPFRLYEQLNGSKDNPFFTPLMQAVESGKASPLVQARMYVLKGDASQAIAKYLSTDPAAWAHYDVQRLSQLRHHSGYTSEVDGMIYAALKGGRVTSVLFSELVDLVSTSSADSNMSLGSGEFADMLEQQDERALQLGVESAKQILKQRQHFARREFDRVLQMNINKLPANLTTESVTLSFLAAAALKDAMQVELWGQEIKRRHPDQETLEWLATITTTST